MDLENRSFVAWNAKFLEQTGFSESEMKTYQPDELLIFGESWSRLSNESDAQKVEYVTCVAKRVSDVKSAPGFVVRSGDKIAYVMLDVFGSSSTQFEQGQMVARKEERSRIAQAFHEEISSSIIAALFLIEAAKGELQEAGLPQAEVVSKASDILTETTKKIAEVLADPDDNRANS